MVCAVSPGTLQSYLYKYFFFHSVPPVPSVLSIYMSGVCGFGSFWKFE